MITIHWGISRLALWWPFLPVANERKLEEEDVNCGQERLMEVHLVGLKGLEVLARFALACGELSTASIPEKLG